MAPNQSFTISPVRNQPDLADTISLFYAYAASLKIDLAFQSFDAEMATMPGKYSPPTGELLLARNSAGIPIGCVACRPLFNDQICEMKRLYVSPDGRGTGIGRALAIAIIEAAEKLGYREMRLDSLTSMTAAQKLYKEFGFVEIDPYYSTPIPNTTFLSLSLPRQTS